MAKYIDNLEQTVAEMMKSVPDAYKIDILVGFFYFSGIQTILSDEKVKNNFLNTKLRILVGLNIDTTLRDLLKASEPKSPYHTQIDAQEEIVSLLNNARFDDKESLHLFFDKLNNGTLEMRKTKDPVHAKIYLFQRDSDESMFGSTTMITGSSNLTATGLGNQIEFNVIENNHDDVAKGQALFNKLWDTSVTVLDHTHAETIKTKIGLLQEISPFEVFLKVLYEYFTFTNTTNLLYSPKEAGFSDYKYQINAIQRAIQAINSHQGVLIADVVGLGKSIIAACVAKNFIESEGLKVYIICPPPLMDSWDHYKNKFKLTTAEVHSLGKLDKILADIGHHKHNALILIDEAHRFRNNTTEQYSTLAQICMGQKVMLLSATPLNNTSSDIFSLIELFQDVNQATIYQNRSIVNVKERILLQEKNLRKSDDPSNRDTLREISEELIQLIRPVLIRRTRIDLERISDYQKDLKQQKTEFNKIEPPQLHDYELNDLSPLYKETLDFINPKNDEITKGDFFQATRYQALNYLVDDDKIKRGILDKIYPDTSDSFVKDSSRNLSKFMRHLLVRRFESSIEAFRKSIKNMITKYEWINEWIAMDHFPVSKQGKMLDVDEFYSEQDDLFDDREEDTVPGKFFDKKKAEEYEEKGFYIINHVKKSFKQEFFDGLNKDLIILKNIQNQWEKVSSDYKLDALITNLNLWLKENPSRKIIIFSEFADTVNYLFTKLKEQKFRILHYTSVNADSKLRERVIDNFDASADFKADDFDILIATDTLSEGINLHRAGVIVNYDIPYNPTRVIQRVGRINRIGEKSFDRLFIHNFIPRLEAQEEINNWQTANFKVNLINAILGSDTKVLQKEEDIEAVFQLEDNVMLDSGEESWDTPYLNLYNDLKNNKLKNINNEIISVEQIQSLPPRLELQRLQDKQGFVEIVRHNNELFASAYLEDAKDSDFYSIKEVFEILNADPTEKFIPSSREFSKNKKQWSKKLAHKSKKYVHDAIKDLHILSKNLEGVDLQYVKELIEIGEQRYLPLSILRKINKQKLTVESKLDELKKLVPQYYIQRIQRRKELLSKPMEESQLLVTEELVRI